MREGPREPRAFGLEQWRMSELPSSSTWAGAPRLGKYGPGAWQVPRPLVASGPTKVGSSTGERTSAATVVIRSRPVDRSSRSSTFAIAGFVIAVVATALVASVPGSPLHPVLPPGVEPGGPFRWMAHALGLDDLHGSGLVFVSVAAVVASAIAFVFVVREAWRGHISLRTAVILAVGAHVVVATLPLLVSRDVYSYIAYGNIAGIHHANPYIRTPSDFPADAVVSLVGPKWLSTPAVYGPLFTGLASSWCGSWTPSGRRSRCSG